DRRVRAVLLVRGLALLLCGAVLSTPATPVRADDTDLFSTIVAPNVMLLVDNSGSMNEMVYHPAYNPNATPTCTYYDNDTIYSWSGNTSITHCGNTRTLYDDTSNALANRISGRYLNWLMSDAADPYYKGTSNNDSDNLESTANGTRSDCLRALG